MTHEVDDFGFPIEHEAPDQVAIVVPSSWRSVDPGLFRAVTDQLRRDWAEMLGLDDPSDLPFNATETGHILNEFAEVYRLENGQFPAFYDAVTATGEIWNRFTRRTTGADLLPDVYKTDNGDGTFNFFENSARSSGPVLMAMATPVDLDGGVTEIPVASNTAVSSRSRNRDQAADDGFGSATREEFLNRRGFGGATMEEFLNRRFEGIPTVSQSDHSRFTGGGADDDDGGSGRGTLAFDRVTLTENANNLWGATLWENAPAGLIDEYVNSTNSLYQSTGVQQGLQAWLMQKMRGTEKYGVMYGRKEPGVSEQEWRARFDTSQFGLRLEDERAQSIRGMSSGAAPESFQQSVEQSRDVQALGQGRFSQRFANSINQLGRLQNR